MREMICSECGWKTKDAAEFHPYLYCLLVKTGQAYGMRHPEIVLREYGFVRAERYGISGGVDARLVTGVGQPPPAESELS